MGRLILFGGVFLGSSAVEQSTVNRPVVGSNPTRGAIFFQSHEKLRQSTLALRAIRQRCYPTPESDDTSMSSYHSTKYRRPRVRYARLYAGRPNGFDHSAANHNSQHLTWDEQRVGK